MNAVIGGLVGLVIGQVLVVALYDYCTTAVDWTITKWLKHFV